MRIEVDGETFEVRARPDEPGVYDLDWVSGPNTDYGFTSARSDRAEQDRDELAAAIRSFLAGIDPETGYLD